MADAQGKDPETKQGQVKEAAHEPEREGTIVDGATGGPIAGAIVTAGDKTVLTDAQGGYRLAAGAQPLQVRAVGYGRASIAAGDGGPPTTKLVPLLPKALYLTVYGIGAPFLRDPALEVIEKSGLNALVIDLKGDRGLIPYPSKLPLAAKIGAQKLRTIPDLKELATTLKGKGVYLIAPRRGVQGRPAGRGASGMGDPHRGRRPVEGPRRPGLDRSLPQGGVGLHLERGRGGGRGGLRRDPVRLRPLPRHRRPRLRQCSRRKRARGGDHRFLREARRRLTPYNVFTAMDSFGYVCWNENDTGIGQRLEDLATAVDIISPMLYPSGFQFGIPGYRNPVRHPYEIVHLTLEECKRRTANTSVRYRPWLQAFTDYAFGGKIFGADEIAKQTKASRDAGTDGWMLWNPRNVYSTNDIKPEPADGKVKATR